MASSDDEEVLAPQSVTNYYFEDGNLEPVSFSVLPLHFDGDDIPEAASEVFLHGSYDGGLQKVFKQVTAVRLVLGSDQPELSVLGKDGKWIQLLKPRKIYEEATARTVMVTVHALHFLRKNPEASEKSLWAHLHKSFSFENIPCEDDIREHHGMIQKFIEKDEVLAKCGILPDLLKERSRKKITNEDIKIQPDSKKAFIADDDEVDEGMKDDEGDDSDEEPDLFDSVCAICDNGGEILCCEGRCLRSFHATRSAGSDTDCKSLGYSRSQVEAIQSFLCKNCQYKKHQCFACGKLGSSDKSAGAEVFPCVNATCGHFYHPKCAARLLYRNNEAEASEFQKKIAAGESFMCPVHKCVVCDKGENKEVKELQFAMCRRCPKSYHRQCLPREISFDDIEEEDIIQRAWDDLLPNRILIYCLDHEIDEELGTPIRNHIKFPEVFEKKVLNLVKKRSQDSVSLPMKKKSQDFENQTMKRKRQDYEEMLKDRISVAPKKAIGKNLSEGGYFSKQSERSISEQVLEPKKKMKLSKDSAKPDSWRTDRKSDGTVPYGSKISSKEKTKPSALIAPPTSTTKRSSFPAIDDEMEKKIITLMEKASSSLTLEGIMRKRTVPSTHTSSGRHIDKSITHGKVEGSIEAIRTALKKVEDGGNVEDAKAVCEPEILKNIVRWNSKLRVYLSPFLHGVRYTSFGRHFTKVDKLMEIVDKLQWYVQSGDTIVDFCCGSNDFSILMKEKLDRTGKKCSYKNFDVIQPKNDFSFEKRDWMTVQPKELPNGSQLIMGLNPPFGVKASLANKFIDKALTFRPKLVILIVPPETERLDRKRTPYDLIWEDREKLSGKSFYLPGSVDVDDKQIEQWNNTPPPLYLWSRSDFTAKHKSIALNQGHLDKELNISSSGGASLEKTMAAPPVKEIYDVHEKNGDDVLGDARRESNNDIEHKKRVQSPESQKIKSRRGGKKKKKQSPEVREVDEGSDMSISPGVDTTDSTELSGRVTSAALETPLERSITPSERTSYQVVSPRYGTDTVLGESINDITKRYATPFPSLDYGIQSSAEQFPSYIKDNTYGRKPSMNDIDGYGRLSDADLCLQPRMYGLQSQEDLIPSRFSLSGTGATLGPPGRYSLGSFGLPSSTTGSSTMQRYAPRLDEMNYPRPGNLAPEMPVPGGSLYDTPGIRRDIHPDSLGFPPGAHNAYARPGSSDWH